jgi:hypothetical protein
MADRCPHPTYLCGRIDNGRCLASSHPASPTHKTQHPASALQRRAAFAASAPDGLDHDFIDLFVDREVHVLFGNRHQHSPDRSSFNRGVNSPDARRSKDSVKCVSKLLLEEVWRVTAIQTPPLVLCPNSSAGTLRNTDAHWREPSSASTSSAENVGAPARLSVIESAIS